jgi:uncharacterized protein involved in type VI secretion and phage assembly
VMDMDVLGCLLAPPDERGRFYGVAVGVVTNNQDPEKLGRVKVKLPWLSDEHESHWARVLTPMAGPERGLYFLPEVDDEVLVAFEHGQVDFPYVLGALWNGKDKPPEKNDDGENNKRTLKSRSGHMITLDDTQDREQIVIRDKTGKNEIVFDSKDNALTIKAEGDLTIEAGGKLILKSNADLALETQAKASLKTQADLVVEATGKASVKSKTNLTLEGTAKSELKGAQVSVNGSAQTEVKGGAVVQVQGGLVKIN